MIKRRKNIRLKEYNYRTDGYYFVTICTALRKPLLEQYRKQAEVILQSLPTKFIGVKIDFYSFVPDHLHVIFILNKANTSLSELVRTYKALVTKATGHKPFWEWNFYEHIIRNDEALNKIRKYILENPMKEKLDLISVYSRINATATKNNRINVTAIKKYVSIRVNPWLKIV
jgi:REP element-mobilizing transposase RayT